jgi:hypothetical protein
MKNADLKKYSKEIAGQVDGLVSHLAMLGCRREMEDHEEEWFANMIQLYQSLADWIPVRVVKLQHRKLHDDA